MTKRFRFILLLVCIAIGGVFIYPTVQWYFFTSAEDQELAMAARPEVREYAQSQARAALTELSELAEAEPESPVPEEYRYVTSLARSQRSEDNREIPSEWTVLDVVASFPTAQDMFDAVEGHHRDRVQRLKDLQGRIVELGLDLSGGISATLAVDEEALAEDLGREPTGSDFDERIPAAIEILRSRIDEFGVSEPSIRRQGTNQIQVDIPGTQDRERVNAFLRGRGSLNFHIVNDEATEELIQYQRENPGWSPAADETPDFVPVGSSVKPYVQRDDYDMDRVVRYIVVHDDIDEYGLEGRHIQSAQVVRDQITGRPEVNFVLDSEGADLFARLTRDNVGNSLAIVMEGNVRAYATIQSEIPVGQVRMTGFDTEQANDIATVLRTESLNVDLVVLNQQTVGAALGEDAIEAGLLAIAVGFLLVFVFMPIYYKGAGFVADIALALNLFLIVAILSVFNLTLTLTSIAGIILTVGMAVDANVVVFERIKEEYRLGKSARASIAAGFQKAMSAVLDSKITTFIAAVFLSQLGTGPVQGFAVTLAVGIVTSLFTGLFVARLAFDFSTDVFKRTKLSIAWGGK